MSRSSFRERESVSNGGGRLWVSCETSLARLGPVPRTVIAAFNWQHRHDPQKIVCMGVTRYHDPVLRQRSSGAWKIKLRRQGAKATCAWHLQSFEPRQILIYHHTNPPTTLQGGDTSDCYPLSNSAHHLIQVNQF